MNNLTSTFACFLYVARSLFEFANKKEPGELAAVMAGRTELVQREDSPLSRMGYAQRRSPVPTVGASLLFFILNPHTQQRTWAGEYSVNVNGSEGVVTLGVETQSKTGQTFKARVNTKVLFFRITRFFPRFSFHPPTVTPLDVLGCLCGGCGSKAEPRAEADLFSGVQRVQVLQVGRHPRLGKLKLRMCETGARTTF